MPAETPNEPQAKPSEDTNRREGNDIAQLVGSGTPMVKVKARANLAAYGLAAGEQGTFVQTENLRLDVANGYLEVVHD